MGGLTEALARFVSGLDIGEIPERALDAARLGFTDCVAVMVAGAGEPAVAIVADLVEETRKDAFAPEIPTGRRLDASSAALVNGVAAHVLDYDDVALSAHPSAVLVPAILAQAHRLDAGGEAALLAYVAGYETWAELKAREPGELHDRGFHPSAVLGTLAAAAACASLARLSPERTREALSIAASMAAGLTANFGTMTKSFHIGRAAQAGVLASHLAARGFTGAGDAIEHRAGFLNAHSPSGRPDVDPRTDLGRRWRIEESGLNIKRYPTCYATHRSIDGMLELKQAGDLAASDVAGIRVRIGGTQHRMLRNARPVTGLEAKFSIEFAMAAALVAGRVSLAELTDDFVRRPDLRSVLEIVSVETTNETLPGDETFAPSDRVDLVLRDGTRLAGPEVVHARGHWARPLSEEEIRAKFDDCTATRLGAGGSVRLWEDLRRLQSLRSIRDLRWPPGKNA